MSALSISILLGTPLLAQADQGKWWTPKQGDPRVERRDVRGGSWGGRLSWRGYPVRRDILVIRDRRYGGWFRARRIYCAPRYYGRFVYVRPVRFFIGADALIGGVGIHARIVRPHYLYGCNFCEARFGSYGAYVRHVEHCADRPDGFGISVSNWNDDSDWNGPYENRDRYHDDHGYRDDPGQYDDKDGGYGDESH